MGEAFTTRQIAELINAREANGRAALHEWQVRRLFEDGTLPEPIKFAGKRAIPVDDIPTIVAACKLRGWLTQPEGTSS